MFPPCDILHHLCAAYISLTVSRVSLAVSRISLAVSELHLPCRAYLLRCQSFTCRVARISCGVRTTSCRGAHITCRDKTSLTVSRVSLAVSELPLAVALTTSCCQLPIIRFRKRLMIDSYYFDLINISNPLMKYFPFSYHSHLVAIPSPSLHSPRYNIISNFRNRITFFFSRKYNPT